MTGTGIAEVADPSALFLGHGEPEPGTCVTIAMGGPARSARRNSSPGRAPDGSQPRRIVNGRRLFTRRDGARGPRERLGLTLSDRDVYVSTVGGGVAVGRTRRRLGDRDRRRQRGEEPQGLEASRAIGETPLTGEIRNVTRPPSARPRPSASGITRCSTPRRANSRRRSTSCRCAACRATTASGVLTPRTASPEVLSGVNAGASRRDRRVLPRAMRCTGQRPGGRRPATAVRGVIPARRG